MVQLMNDEEKHGFHEHKARLYQDALIYLLEHILPSKPELLIHNDHQAMTIKLNRDKKIIFFGDGKALVSEKSSKGLPDTLKEEKI